MFLGGPMAFGTCWLLNDQATAVFSLGASLFYVPPRISVLIGEDIKRYFERLRLHLYTRCLRMPRSMDQPRMLLIGLGFLPATAIAQGRWGVAFAFLGSALAATASGTVTSNRIDEGEVDGTPEHDEDEDGGILDRDQRCNVPFTARQHLTEFALSTVALTLWQVSCMTETRSSY